MSQSTTSDVDLPQPDSDSWVDAIGSIVDCHDETMRRVRRQLHAHPEVSGNEEGTTRYLKEQLESSQVEGNRVSVNMGLGGRGFWVDGGTNDVPDDQPVIGVRGDIDALRIQETNQADYCSTVEGVMHACGHDAHSAMALGVCLTLDQAANEGVLPWPVRYRGIFQPAEETATGACEMIDAGAIEGLTGIIALHVDPSRPLGTVGVRKGDFTADCEEIVINVYGCGGHASRPHESRDPIAAAAQFISALYQFVHRSIDSHDSVVVTIGEIKGGANYNVIPDHVMLRGTMRSFDKQVKQTAIRRIEQLANGIAQASDTRIEITFTSGPPAVRNDAILTDLIRKSATPLLGEDHVHHIENPSMGGEDFAYYLSKVPGAMFRLGTRSDERTATSLHSPNFDIDESAMAIGAKILACTVINWSDPNRQNEPAYMI